MKTTTLSNTGRTVRLSCMCVLVRKSLRAPLKEAIRDAAADHRRSLTGDNDG